MLFAGTVTAAPLDDLQRDFKPIEGYLILVKKDLCLVDLDASDGLMAGDLLVVKQKSSELVHPVSGEIIEIGNADPAILQITMVDKGFSRARPVTSGKEIEPGQPVIRYAGMTAALLVQSGDGSAIYQQLSSALPQLLWQGYRRVDETGRTPGDVGLSFHLDGETLTVKDAAGKLLHSYSWPTVAKNDGSEHQAISSAPPDVPSRDASVGKPHYVGTVEGEVVMAAFTERRGEVLVATTDGRTIRIFKAAEELTQLTEYAVPITEEALTLYWWQPEAGGKLYLVVSAAIQREVANSVSVNTSISSVVYEFSDKSLSILETVRGMFLGSFDVDNDGQSETLLGQAFRITDENEPVFKFTLRDGHLQRTEPSLKLPAEFKVQGSMIIDLDGDDQLEVVQVDNGYLAVYKEGEELYRSPRKFGGSISRLTYDRTSGSVNPLFTTRFFQIAPVAYDLDRDNLPEVIAASGDIPTVRMPGLGSGVSRTWLSILDADGRRYVKSDLGPEFDMPIQGLWVAKQGLFVLVTTPQNIFGQDGHAEIQSISLVQ